MGMSNLHGMKMKMSQLGIIKVFIFMEKDSY